MVSINIMWGYITKQAHGLLCLYVCLGGGGGDGESSSENGGVVFGTLDDAEEEALVYSFS
jgi:hypothetical protein